MDLHRPLVAAAALALVVSCSSGDRSAQTAPSTATPAGTPTTAPSATAATTPGTLSQPVQESLNKMCERLDRVSQAVGGIGSIDEVPQALGAMADATQGLLRDLSDLENALDEPRSAAVQDVIDTANAGLERLGDAPERLLVGNRDQATAALDDARAKFTSARRKASDLGATNCGETGSR